MLLYVHFHHSQLALPINCMGASMKIKASIHLIQTEIWLNVEDWQGEHKRKGRLKWINKCQEWERAGDERVDRIKWVRSSGDERVELNESEGIV